MIAVLYGHDDQVIAEMQVPSFTPEIRMARASAVTWKDEPSMEPIAYTVDEYVVDAKETLLMQLAYQNPDIVVYRKSNR